MILTALIEWIWIVLVISAIVFHSLMFRIAYTRYRRLRFSGKNGPLRVLGLLHVRGEVVKLLLQLLLFLPLGVLAVLSPNTTPTRSLFSWILTFDFLVVQFLIVVDSFLSLRVRKILED